MSLETLVAHLRQSAFFDQLFDITGGGNQIGWRFCVLTQRTSDAKELPKNCHHIANRNG